MIGMRVKVCICFVISFILLGSTLQINETGLNLQSKASSSNYIENQPAWDSLNWHTIVTNFSSFDYIGAGNKEHVALFEGWNYSLITNETWSQHSIPSSGTSPTDYYFSGGSDIYISSDGPDGTPAPYNYNGMYGSDTPGKSYITTHTVNTTTSTNSQYSGSSIFERILTVHIGQGINVQLCVMLRIQFWQGQH